MSAVIPARVEQHRGIKAALPLVVLPLSVVLFANNWSPWIFMWTLSFTIYAGLKWLSFAAAMADCDATLSRSLSYLLLWPGMDAKSFLTSSRQIEHPGRSEWLQAVTKVMFGLGLIVSAVPLVDQHAMIAGWIGMAGVVFALHFGLFHLLSMIWRLAGIDAPPIMDAPILSASLSEFWGKRWNLAFRDLAHTFIFRPFVGRLGIAGATLAVFFVSGVVHDAVISISSGGGYGLPTLYFVIQGIGVLFERSRLGKRLGTRHGLTGRFFCAAVTLAPVCLLFHQTFVEQVVNPMLTAFGSLGS